VGVVMLRLLGDAVALAIMLVLLFAFYVLTP
jgi:hypothetical protein